MTLTIFRKFPKNLTGNFTELTGKITTVTGRHSFKRQMLEAGLDYDLRCRIMGHAIARPNYGGGADMRFRREQLPKIAHQHPEDQFDYVNKSQN